MDLSMEDYFLNLWYTVMQIIFGITPPIYLAISSEIVKTPSLPGYRIMLPLLTSFAALCLVNEAYNLARPVYVCFFPVRGETFHHPEETRLKIQWILNSLACILAAVAAVDHIIENMAPSESKKGQAVSRQGDKGDKKRDFEYRAKEMEGLSQLGERRFEKCWGRGRAGQYLMLIAWVVGMCGYWAMLGRSKKGAFAF